MDSTVASRALALSHYRHHARYYKLEVESVTELGTAADDERAISFLDVSLTPRRTPGHLCVFDVAPYAKPTSIWVPLAHTSAHPDSVHAAWPRAYEQRLRDHSSDDVVAKGAIRAFRSKLRLNSPGHPGLLWAQRSSLARRPSSTHPVAYCVIPYHAVWKTARLNRIFTSFDSCLDGLHAKRLRVCWSLGGQHLLKLCTGINNRFR